MATAGPYERFFNLTPHDVTIYADDGETILVNFPSDGKFRLKSKEQRELGKIYVSKDLPPIPILEGQVFIGVDDTQPGTGLWHKYSTGSFIVSLPMAQWLVSPDGCDIAGGRRIYCPATDDKRGIRNAAQQIIGCRYLEYHTPAPPDDTPAAISIPPVDVHQ
jgi:hypothetical protein